MKIQIRASRILTIFLLPFLLLAAGCDLLGHDDDDHSEDHHDFDRVVIESFGMDARTTVATWTREDGWDEDELPTITLEAHQQDAHDHLRAESDHDDHDEENYVAWRVRIFDSDGDELPLNEGGEYEARYWLAQDADEDVIYFDSSGTVNLDHDHEGELWHGDHVHVYPREPGTTEIEFLLWHGSHPDSETDPITIRVEEQSDDEDR